MPKKPNYDFERRERDRAKAAKKAAKLADKAAAREKDQPAAESVATTDETED